MASSVVATAMSMVRHQSGRWLVVSVISNLSTAIVGPVVNLSARLMIAAQRYIAKDSVAILVDAETHKLSEQYFNWHTPDPIFVKGKVDAVSIFRPLSRHTSEKIFLTKAARMVGRDEEYAALNVSLNAVRESGQGRMAVIEGEQGLGKSLLWERLARGTGLPVGKGDTKKMESTTAFAPISRLLSRYSSLFMWHRSSLDLAACSQARLVSKDRSSAPPVTAKRLCRV